MRTFALFLLCLTSVCSTFNANAAPHTSSLAAPDSHFEWVTLGTMGGPVPQPGRNEPANLLVRAGDAHLVDVGDGAATAMVAAGAQYPQLKSIWISHIHFDHIGGLFGVLGLRLQTRTVTPLTIYGPPGTKEIIDGLIRAMRPSARSGFGVPGEVAIDPGATIKVVELDDGAKVQMDGFAVTVAANTHYSFAPGSPEERYFKSLSFRFDLADRSILYTGDTGPSPRVTALAQGADVLVTELIDFDATLAMIDRTGAGMAPQDRLNMAEHLRRHHLTPQDIGALAAKAKVGQVIVTHIAGNVRDPQSSHRYLEGIRSNYSGPVVIARDLQRF